MKKISIRGLYFYDDLLPSMTQNFALKSLDGENTRVIFTPNAEIAQMCVEDTALTALFNEADLLIPDGAGVVLASKILGTPLKCKIAGIELGEDILSHLYETASEKRVFFLGGKPGVAEKAKENLLEKYPNLQIVGTHDGYFDKTGAENDAVIQKINESGAELLYVCLGAPAQEKWIMANKARLTGVSLMLGLGGSLDVWADEVKRAPKIFIKLNLEWFYRLIKEPRRIGRMMKLPKYILGTAMERCRRHKHDSAPDGTDE